MKPSPTLSNMPVIVQTKIFGFTDPFTQLNIILCSRDLQKAIEKTPVHLENLSIHISQKRLEVKYFGPNNRKFVVCFQDYPRGHTVNKTFEKFTSKVEKGNFVEGGVKFLKTVFERNLKNRVFIKELSFSVAICDDEKKLKFFNELSQFFNVSGPRDFRISTDKLTVSNSGRESDIVKILNLVKPGILKHQKYIGTWHTVWPFYNMHPFSMFQIPEMEHWKKASHLELEGYSMDLLLEKWSHLEFSDLTIDNLMVETVRFLVEKFLRSPTWKFFYITTDFLHDETRYFLENFNTIPGLATPVRLIQDADANGNIVIVFTQLVPISPVSAHKICIIIKETTMAEVLRDFREIV